MSAGGIGRTFILRGRWRMRFLPVVAYAAAVWAVSGTAWAIIFMVTLYLAHVWGQAELGEGE